MIHFEDILEKVEAYNPNSDQDLLRRAYVFSAREHRGQVRRSGEPYLVHPLNVASILADNEAQKVGTKNLNVPLYTASVSGNIRINESNNLEVSQALGSRGLFSGVATWQISNVQLKTSLENLFSCLASSCVLPPPARA